MSFRQNRALIVIVGALAVAGWGVYWTGEKPAAPAPSAATGAPRRAPSNRSVAVDQTSLMTAEELVRTPVTPDERSFAEDALRIADNEMDLAFAAAVRRIANQPRATSDTAKEAEARLQKALRALTADQARVTSLTGAVAKASASNAEALNDQLNLATAQAALDQDEVDDARMDLRRAGGDPQGRMEDLIAEHDAASKGSDTLRIVVANAVVTRGLVRHAKALWTLYQKESQLRDAAGQADSIAAAMKERHDRVEARAAARAESTATARVSHDSAKALLEAAQQAERDGRTRASLDQRMDNQHALADVYTGWIGVLHSKERGAINRVLRDVLLILTIVLISMLIGRWIEHLLRTRVSRVQTHHLAVRVSLQFVAILFILLVIFGRPDNLGTVLGLVGAGLTVALKDFILGFFGWFVLMGKNGIRLGDLIEVKGVTGEVVDLGVFRTVLLETGHWSESGHPTGRRVTINNSFAIEGHYINFSSSGRWLWDEVRVVVPVGRDPYPIAAALQKQMEEATAASAREAQAQWSQTRLAHQAAVPAMGASFSLRPAATGVEITVRYITRVSDREELRSKLYRTAVDMLGAGRLAPVTG